ncbi:Uncharacterised protein [uncultured archaeon]|nr:Uncharacterised protein [uncultured archaeon]
MNVFQILAMAIAAVAIIYLISGFFGPSDDSTLQEMKNALSYAEQNTGKLHEAELSFRSGFGTKAELLDSESRNARFKCMNPETCIMKKIDYDARMLSVKEKFTSRVFFRCRKVLSISDCVIYLGEEPAQLELQNISFSAPKRKGNSVISFEVKNTGAMNAVDSEWNVKLYMEKNEGVDEKLVLVEEKLVKLPMIAPWLSTEVSTTFAVPSGGKFILKAVAEGEDSGMDSWEKEFDVEGTLPEACVAVSAEKPTLYNGLCRTKHTCTGCEYDYECRERWVAKGMPESEVADSYTSAVYTEKPAVNGACN